MKTGDELTEAIIVEDIINFDIILARSGERMSENEARANLVEIRDLEVIKDNPDIIPESDQESNIDKTRKNS